MSDTGEQDWQVEALRIYRRLDPLKITDEDLADFVENRLVTIWRYSATRSCLIR